MFNISVDPAKFADIDARDYSSHSTIGSHGFDPDHFEELLTVPSHALYGSLQAALHSIHHIRAAGAVRIRIGDGVTSVTGEMTVNSEFDRGRLFQIGQQVLASAEALAKMAPRAILAFELDQICRRQTQVA